MASSPGLLKAKALHILEILDRLYPEPPVPLNHSNDFTFLVAVVLSAQTTDGKVNEVTKDLFKIADNPYTMSRLDYSYVQQIIQPVGLAPKKAQYLVNLSKLLVEKHNGKVPSTYEELEALPGVGHKTASVIMSQLFQEHAFAVDTHVHRLSLRWGLSKEQTNVAKVQEDLCAAFPQESWDRVHLQMIYFGREYCAAKSHTPADCPICCWVNRPQPEKFDEAFSALESFTPQKRMKGLIYYHDRIQELKDDPTLAPFSPTPSRSSTISALATPVHVTPSKLEFMEAKDDNNEPQRSQPARRRKRERET